MVSEIREEELLGYHAKPEVGTAEATNPLQQRGYVRVYRSVADSTYTDEDGKVKPCGVMVAYLYGVLEDYAQLGQRTGMGCVPARITLADKLGVSDRTITRYIAILCKAGWVRTKPSRDGTTNDYTLTATPNEWPDNRVHQPETNCPPTPRQTPRQTPSQIVHESNTTYPELERTELGVTALAKRDAGGASAIVIEQDDSVPVETPKSLLKAFHEAAHLDWHKATPDQMKKEAAMVTRLVKKGFTSDEVSRCTAWLRTRFGDPVKVESLVGQIESWRMAGEPVYYQNGGRRNIQPDVGELVTYSRELREKGR